MLPPGVNPGRAVSGLFVLADGDVHASGVAFSVMFIRVQVTHDQVTGCTKKLISLNCSKFCLSLLVSFNFS